jgi:hypothetical protein
VVDTEPVQTQDQPHPSKAHSQQAPQHTGALDCYYVLMPCWRIGVCVAALLPVQRVSVDTQSVCILRLLKHSFLLMKVRCMLQPHTMPPHVVFWLGPCVQQCSSLSFLMVKEGLPRLS